MVDKKFHQKVNKRLRVYAAKVYKVVILSLCTR